MYKVSNNKTRNTSLPLRGKGITLSPKGSKGDSLMILDMEIKDPAVVLLLKRGFITLEQVPNLKKKPLKPKKASPPVETAEAPKTRKKRASKGRKE